MSLGEKLAKLRKQNNYTQEELADILHVSRQAISKWESDTAYPETDKLVKLGELYDCSLDYLLKDGGETTSPSADARKVNIVDLRFDLKNIYFERKSKTVIFGMPLWHINIGIGRTAKGIFSVGLCSVGICSVGLVSLGVLSIGLIALGLMALGSIALGFMSLGAISIGIIAFGAIAVGLLAVGAVAVGQFSIGALSVGNYIAVGANANALIAIGKDEAVGTIFSAPEITTENKAQIFALLDENVPAVFGWLKELVKMILR